MQCKCDSTSDWWCLLTCNRNEGHVEGGSCAAYAPWHQGEWQGSCVPDVAHDFIMGGAALCACSNVAGNELNNLVCC